MLERPAEDACDLIIIGYVITAPPASSDSREWPNFRKSSISDKLLLFIKSYMVVFAIPETRDHAQYHCLDLHSP
jgi:hypothetical protein